MKLKMLEKMFDYINAEMFDNILDKPYLHVLTKKQARALWPEPIDGICVPIKDWYFVGIHKDLTKNEAFDTMVHEMIHMYLMDKCNYSGHGKKFKKACRKAIDIFYYNML